MRGQVPPVLAQRVAFWEVALEQGVLAGRDDWVSWAWPQLRTHPTRRLAELVGPHLVPGAAVMPALFPLGHRWVADLNVPTHAPVLALSVRGLERLLGWAGPVFVESLSSSLQAVLARFGSRSVLSGHTPLLNALARSLALQSQAIGPAHPVLASPDEPVRL
jgi:hypothetical protein